MVLDLGEDGLDLVEPVVYIENRAATWLESEDEGLDFFCSSEAIVVPPLDGVAAATVAGFTFWDLVENTLLPLVAAVPLLWDEYRADEFLLNLEES